MLKIQLVLANLKKLETTYRSPIAERCRYALSVLGSDKLSLPDKYAIAAQAVCACVAADLSEYEAKLISQTAGLLVELLWEISEERYK